LDIPKPPNIAGNNASKAELRDDYIRGLPPLKQFSAGESVKIDKLPEIIAKTVELSNLKLPIGKNVLAKVVGSLDGDTLSFNNKIALRADIQPDPNAQSTVKQTKPTAQTLQTAPTNVENQKQWLIQIAQNYILTETKAPLSTGQTIYVTSSGPLSLQLTALGTTTAYTSGPQAPAGSELSAKQIQAIIRATLSSLLPQQASIYSGFNALQNSLNPGFTSSLPTQQYISQAQFIAQLANALSPKSSQITALAKDDTFDALTLPKTIEQWIKASGLNREADSLKLHEHTLGLVNKKDQIQSQNTILRSALLLATELSPSSALSKPTQYSQLITTLANATYETLKLTAFRFQPDTAAPINAALSTADGTLIAVNKTLSNEFNNQLLNSNQAIQTLHKHASTLINLFGSLSTERPAATQTVDLMKQVLADLKHHNNQATIEIGKLISVAHSAQNSGSTTTDGHGLNAQTIAKALQSIGNKNTIPSPQQLMSAAVTLIPELRASHVDFKGVMQALASQLATLEKSGNTAAQAQNLAPQGSQSDTAKAEIRGLSEQALLQKPFDFPRFDAGVLKAQAIMSDQDLTTGQLLKLVASMINRIQFNQTNSLYQTQTSADPSLVQSWNMELPYTHQQQVQTLQLRIDQHKQQSHDESKQNDEKAHSWTIQLSFNLEGIGPLHIQAEFTPPKLRSEIWVDSQDAQQLVRAEQALLIERLKKSGIEAEPPSCRVGRPPQIKPAEIRHGLVDIRA